MRLIRAALVLLACFVPRAAHAQLSADSLSLARITAAAIDDVYVGTAPAKRVLILSAHAPFDSAVNLALRQRSGFQHVVRDSAYLTWVGTRGVVLAPDTTQLYRLGGMGATPRDSGVTFQVGTTVAVAVEEKGSMPDDGSGLNLWGGRTAYLFTRTPEGWRFVRRKQLSNWDGGVVRDTPEPRRMRVRKDGG